MSVPNGTAGALLIVLNAEMMPGMPVPGTRLFTGTRQGDVIGESGET